MSGRFPDVAAVEQALHINGCIKKLALMCTRSKEPENVRITVSQMPIPLTSVFRNQKYLHRIFSNCSSVFHRAWKRWRFGGNQYTTLSTPNTILHSRKLSLRITLWPNAGSAVSTSNKLWKETGSWRKKQDSREVKWHWVKVMKSAETAHHRGNWSSMIEKQLFLLPTMVKIKQYVLNEDNLCLNMSENRSAYKK